MTKIALVDEYGAYLHVKDGRFRLKVGNNVKWEASPMELDSIVFTVDGVSISVSSIILAASYGIDLVFIKALSLLQDYSQQSMDLPCLHGLINLRRHMMIMRHVG